jgi:AcrR family transcriptional regulator
LALESELTHVDTATSYADRTRARILDAAEELLRRYGPSKTKVVDVARHLGMSHTNVYRHFENKADIQDLVAARWLKQLAEPLEAIAAARGLATQRLRNWVDTLIKIKYQRIRDDPEMFATYNVLAEDSREVIDEHVGNLRAQLAAIIADGVKQGQFKVRSVQAAAQAVHEATSRFHHPYFVTRQLSNSRDVKVCMDLLIAGLRAGVV